MRVIVKLKPTKKGYTVYNKQGVKIAVVDRLNLLDCYRTKIKGKAALCGLYSQYDESCDASYRLESIDNLALEVAVLTGYGVFAQPMGTVRERN